MTAERVSDPEIDAAVEPWRTDDEAAQIRWAIHNRRARAAGCPCGKPAMEVTRDALGNGAVHELWRCTDHVGVESWAGREPRWTRLSPCGSCIGHCSTMTKIGEEWPEKWYCPTKPERRLRERP